MPLPFTRVMSYTEPPMEGNDVLIAQTLLARSPYVPAKQLNMSAGAFDNSTKAAVLAFQKGNGLSEDGIVGTGTASALLNLHVRDGYKHIETIPEGYLYLLRVTVHVNRSIEVNATLNSRDEATGAPVPLMSLRVRCHGKDFAPNQLSSDGDTPSGLAELDLNSPEDDPADFGPYPVNRVVKGLAGNLGLVAPNIRNGLLVHTGEWSGWTPSDPMPNSNGCIHGHPDAIKGVWKALVGIGVEVRQNTFGKLPYPYKSQGLLSVEEIP